jgi:hypothetical protein
MANKYIRRISLSVQPASGRLYHIILIQEYNEITIDTAKPYRIQETKDDEGFSIFSLEVKFFIS